MAASLERAGLPDTPEVNDEIIRHLLDVGQRVTPEMRVDVASTLTGSAGRLRILSTWTILPDGRAHLATIKLIPIK